MKVLGFLKKHSGIILTIGSSVGVVVTSVLSAKCTTKYNEIMEETEFEDDEKIAKVLTTVKIYSPAIISGTITIASIIANHKINDNKQKALIAAYAMLNGTYSQFKSAAKKVYGEDAVQRIQVQMAKDAHVNAQSIYGENIDVCSAVDELSYAPAQDEILFYDGISKTYFNSTEAQILKAQLHLNRNFTARGFATVNEWLIFIGLEDKANELGDTGDMLIWDMGSDDIFNIDFDHQRFVIDDGNGNEIEGVSIFPIIEPELCEDI